MPTTLPEEIPDLRSIILKLSSATLAKTKLSNKANYYHLAPMIISKPQNDRETIFYGLWFLDIKNIQASRFPQIKQDILSFNLKTDKVIYYTGKARKETTDFKNFKTFNKKWGRHNDLSLGQYGVHQDPSTGNLLNSIHHFNDENDDRLPQNAIFRSLIKEEIEKIRSCT